MKMKYRLKYNGDTYVFDEHPLKGVDVTKPHMLDLTTAKGQNVSIFISPEIPMQVIEVEDKPRGAKFM
ncbi:hypothetical protein [Leucobacter denitrificans]|uniref:Uncharacterized protein n=1 Tax=Leucobacter denitrificans TaxID=683042 RepID=A0A7G9S3C5_9MICO|nr:hypothetical protein [Leucobacter denitrificans]QNN62350.1 hypothetical protein H9L06_08765 [Leucobacter denitrificans]